MGWKLYWCKESRPFHWISCDVDRNVRLDVVRWIYLLQQHLRHKLQRWLVGCIAGRQHMYAVDGLGDVECRLTFNLGYDSSRLSRISNHMVGNDDK